MKKYIATFCLFVLLSPASGLLNAQPHLTPEEAVRTALENNYNIRLSRIDEKIATNNYTRGNAGFLPTVTASANQNNSVVNSRQEYLDRVNERDNAQSHSFSTGAAMNWTVFDGLRMFANYDILKNMVDAADLRTRMEMENTIAQTLAGYYRIVILEEKKLLLYEAVKIGRERELLAEDKLTLGAGSRLEVLQSTVDLNADSMQIINLATSVKEAMVNLNVLMGRPANETFTVNDTIRLSVIPSLDILLQRMHESNARLLLSDNDLEIVNLQLKEIRGRRYPTVGVNLGYNLNTQNSESGIVQSSRTLGFNYGLNANVRLFDGFNQRRLEKNARAEIDRTHLEKEQFVEMLSGELVKSYESYQSLITLIALERQNVQTAWLNFDIAKDRFRFGEMAGIEYRNAQLNFLAAQDRLMNELFNARLLEIEIAQLTGSLIP